MKILKKRVNDTAIVQLGEKLYTRTGVTDADWIEILETIEKIQSVSDDPAKLANTIKSLLTIIDDDYIREQKRIENMLTKIFVEGLVELNDELRKRRATRLVSELGNDFEMDENGFTYFKGVKQPLPKVMVDSLLDAKLNPNSNYTLESLINFWKYVLLNPDKHIREGLFKWLQTGKFAITEDGNIIAYRNVNIKTLNGVDKNLYNFVQESWSKVKRWKKSPSKYKIAKINDEFLLVKDDYYNEDAVILGHLDIVKGIFDNQSSRVVYCPDHKGPYGQHIELGIPVKMPRAECDNDPNSSCSRGLHAKSVNYGLNLGSEILVILVNPYNVVAIPTKDVTKFRCCEYLPVSKAELKNGKLVEFEPGTYDITYDGLESLEELLQSCSLTSLQENGLVSNELNLDDFKVVFNSAKAIITNRIIKA